MQDNADPDSLSARLAVIERVLLDPPRVHYMSPEDVAVHNQSGVWSTERQCYEYLATCCRAGSRTLETGSGLSTVLFAAWHTNHLCVTPGAEEAEAVLAYCQAKDIPTDGLTFDLRPSHEALPQLPAGELDAVLIDGGHGFPTPMLDWYFACRRLRLGGVLVVDDLQLPAVGVLTEFLHADPRWVRRAGTEKWEAFERSDEGGFLEDWYMQPFYTRTGAATPLAREVSRLERRVAALRPRLKRALRRAPGQPGSRS